MLQATSLKLPSQFSIQNAHPSGWSRQQAGQDCNRQYSGNSSSYKGTYGASVLKLGSLTAASVGMTEKRLKSAGKKYIKIYTHPSSSASYYPGATRMDAKLMFSEDGTILGAQIIGQSGVDKRIDTIAQAMFNGLKAWTLGELELSYAPPFSSAKDPVNYLGYVASNVLSGKSTPFTLTKFPKEL
ncbi:MAG: hypothetical protein ACLUKN_15105 [Bacilli bacterium]